jgi:hypothetical protein
MLWAGGKEGKKNKRIYICKKEKKEEVLPFHTTPLEN